MKGTCKIFIGTSGWHYDHWRGPFYPPGLKSGDFLGYYATLFNTVEINSSFYRVPEVKTLTGWREKVPEGFIFSLKASRFITHNKNLKDPEKTLPLFFERIERLGVKLGPVLFQLPPRWKLNLERFECFLNSLPRGRRYAFELRGPAWFDPRVYEALKKHNAAFCIYDLNGIVSPKIITADFIYIRLHGPDGPYRGQYTAEALKGWAGDFSRWSERVGEIFCYFDNDEAGYAPNDALRLQEMVRSSTS